MNYTEDTLVQQTTADYLEQQLRWRSVYAYNNEDFGPGSLLGRDSDREVVLERTLREKLAALNPGLPVSAYDEAVRQITATVASQTLAAANREKYELMRDGVQVTFRNDRGERDRRRLRLFDFDEPDNNDFLCVRELWVRGDLYRRRADIIGFVNGLPLLFIECKNLHKNLRAAFEQNYSDYRDTIPHLFHHNAIVMFGNGEQGYQVFHDVIGEGFNLDHVVIGPAGVFTIETKTWSKPEKGSPKITFDGEHILVGGFTPDCDPVLQAKAQSGWLRGFLSESTGRTFTVKPVIVFPGWFIEQKPGATKELWVLEPKALPSFLSNAATVLSPEGVKLASFHLSRFVRSHA